jgi:ABC-type multidrug transport system permease subunit
MKENHYFEHYSVLPIAKISLITALVIRCTLFSLPSMLMVLIFGNILFDLGISINSMTIVSFVVSGFALAGIGGIIGLYSKNSDLARLATEIVHPILVFVAPVLVPIERLHPVLQKLAYFLPTTYIANMFRANLAGDMGTYFWINFMIVIIFMLLSIYLITIRLDWRID